ncbi:MAG TPA: V-type ATP synthase subunit D [Candidatus Limnocylindrales bacterium]|nr:V-type ATP synthase subunit D [Candidatus Limnocylindrales bacterium]
MAARLRGLPPGRAGLTWLVRRSDVATRGGDLLERKLRILLAEEQDYAMQAERTAAEWSEAVGDLERWMLRAAVLSGERGTRLASDGGDGEVEVTWTLTMGVRYPSSATWWAPERPVGAFPPDNSALRHARPAAERAVRAGVDHAVAVAAHEAVRAEIATTRRQLRALRERWIPRLQSAHAALVVALDDQEHDEHVRLRWAADPTTAGRARP